MKNIIIKSRSLIFVFSILCFMSVFVSTKCFAATETINDGAGLLSSDEKLSLEEECNQIKSTYKTDMFIVTTNSTNGSSHEKYLSDYSDSTGVSDCVLLLICMDSNNRGFYIESFGTAEDYLTNTRINSIVEEIKPMLKGGSYHRAMKTFLVETSTYLSDLPTDREVATDKENYSSDSSGRSDKDGLFYQLWFQILISFGIGGAIVLVMALNASGKVTVTQSTYLDHNSARILAQHDHYLRTTVTKTRIQNDNNSSGSSGGSGTSSDGNSYNGGGSSF